MRLAADRFLVLLAWLASACASAPNDAASPEAGADGRSPTADGAGTGGAVGRRDASMMVGASRGGGSTDAGDRALREAGTIRDARVAEDGPVGTLPPEEGTRYVRVAHFMDEDTPVHVCARGSATTGTGGGAAWLPVTGSPALGGLPGGLARWQVSGYVALPAGPLDLRIVSAAGGPGCSDHVVAETTASPGGKLGTLLVRGALSHPDVSLLPDDLAPDPSVPRLRLVHAAPEQGTLLASTEACTWSCPGVSYTGAIAASSASPATSGSCGSSTDSSGYASVDPVKFTPPGTDTVLRIVDPARAWELDRFLSPALLSLFRPGSVSTAFFHADPSADSGFGLTVCEDTWPSHDARSSCVSASHTTAGGGAVRLVNGWSDRTLDVCLKPYGSPWAPEHRKVSGLGYLGDAIVRTTPGTTVEVGFVPEGAPCASRQLMHDSWLTWAGLTLVLTVPPERDVPDAFAWDTAGMQIHPRFSIDTQSTDDISMFSGVTLANHGDPQYSYGPVTMPDPDLTTPIGGYRPRSLSLSPAQIIGVYTQPAPALDGGSRGGSTLHLQTSAPVTAVADHRYFRVFAARDGTEPTDLLVCDLTLPPPPNTVPPCERYALRPAL